MHLLSKEFVIKGILLIAIVGVIAINVAQGAEAQSQVVNSEPNASTEIGTTNSTKELQLKICKEMAIPADKCSDQAIMQARGGQHPFGDPESEQNGSGFNWQAIIIISAVLGGLSMAFILWYVIKKRDAVQRSGQGRS